MHLLNQITNERIRDLIDANYNRYCSVVFLKKDGTLRRMIVHQSQMKNNVLGTERGRQAAETCARNNPTLVKAWDNNKKAFRSFHLDAVLSVRASGRLWRFRTLAGLPIDHDAIPLPRRVA